MLIFVNIIIRIVHPLIALRSIVLKEVLSVVLKEVLSVQCSITFIVFWWPLFQGVRQKTGFRARVWKAIWVCLPLMGLTAFGLGAGDNYYTALFVMVPQYPAQYHQYSSKEHLENAVKPYFDEGYGPQSPNTPIDSKIGNIIFHSKLSTHWISEKSVVRFSLEFA